MRFWGIVALKAGNQIYNWLFESGVVYHVQKRYRNSRWNVNEHYQSQWKISGRNGIYFGKGSPIFPFGTYRMEIRFHLRMSHIFQSFIAVSPVWFLQPCQICDSTKITVSWGKIEHVLFMWAGYRKPGMWAEYRNLGIVSRISQTSYCKRVS